MALVEVSDAVHAWNLAQTGGMTDHERDDMGTWLDTLEPAGHA